MWGHMKYCDFCRRDFDPEVETHKTVTLTPVLQGHQVWIKTSMAVTSRTLVLYRGLEPLGGTMAAHTENE